MKLSEATANEASVAGKRLSGRRRGEEHRSSFGLVLAPQLQPFPPALLHDAPEFQLNRTTRTIRTVEKVSWDNCQEMPKVISYTPSWLSRPSPGAALFSSPAPKDPGSLKSPKAGYLGPSRTLARRGNEVFTVVDNQIRWSSLTRLKDEWQQRDRAKSQKNDAEDGAPYRVCL